MHRWGRGRVEKAQTQLDIPAFGGYDEAKRYSALDERDTFPDASGADHA